MTPKEESGAKISHEGAISKEAFARAWSTGTLEDQGRMLFDLLGESVIARIRNIEENQRNNILRLDKIEEKAIADQERVQKDLTILEKKWVYIAGGIAVIAILVVPLVTFFLQSLRSTGVCP